MNPELEALAAYDGPDAVITWREYLASSRAQKKNGIRIGSGFSELDSLVGDFKTGEVISISGNTGQGKTLFARSLVKQFVEQEVPTLVFSFEVSADEFLEPYQRLTNCETLEVPRSLKTGSLDWIEKRVIESKLKFDNKVVVIDHLHYIVDMQSNENFSLKVGHALRTLKQRISIGLNQVVVLICHQQSISGDKEPSISTIRDSSFIGQESDMVFIVHRLPDKIHDLVQEGARTKRVKIAPEDYTYDMGQSMVKIDKARRSGVYKKRLTFVKKTDWLEPL